MLVIFLFFIIVFIFIAINHIIWLKQPQLFFGHFCQGIVSSSLISCQYLSGVAYESVAYKNSAYLRNRVSVNTLME